MTEHAGEADIDAARDAVRVDVTVRADPHQLPLLRRIASAIAASLDFDIDTMADIRMAVDELGATALTRARQGGDIGFEFRAEPGAITIVAVVQSDTNEPVDQETFGWMVLTALTSSATAVIDATEDGGASHRITLVVQPERADP